MVVNGVRELSWQPLTLSHDLSGDLAHIVMRWAVWRGLSRLLGGYGLAVFLVIAAGAAVYLLLRDRSGRPDERRRRRGY